MFLKWIVLKAIIKIFQLKAHAKYAHLEDIVDKVGLPTTRVCAVMDLFVTQLATFLQCLTTHIVRLDTTVFLDLLHRSHALRVHINQIKNKLPAYNARLVIIALEQEE